MTALPQEREYFISGGHVVRFRWAADLERGHRRREPGGLDRVATRLPGGEVPGVEDITRADVVDDRDVEDGDLIHRTVMDDERRLISPRDDGQWRPLCREPGDGFFQ